MAFNIMRNKSVMVSMILMIFLAFSWKCEGFVPNIFRGSSRSRSDTESSLSSTRAASLPIPTLWDDTFFVDPLAIVEQNPLRDLGEISLAKVDWKETPESHLINIEVPGIKKHDIRIEYEEDVLTVRGEQKKEKKEKGETWHREERAEGSFMRRFRLPDANMDAVKASLTDGVLYLTVPKTPKQPQPEPKVIPLEDGQPNTLTKTEL